MNSNRFASIGALLCGVSFATVTFAQIGQGSTLIYPERLRADVEYFSNIIQRTHPDPFRYCTKEELDQVFVAVMDSISRPMTREQFLFTLLPVFHRIGDARLSPRLDGRTEDRLKRNVSLLPLRVRILEEGLYLDDELKGFRSFNPGSRILSVNGIEVERLLVELGHWVVTDGANESLRTRLVERDHADSHHLSGRLHFRAQNRIDPREFSEWEDSLFNREIRRHNLASNPLVFQTTTRHAACRNLG